MGRSEEDRDRARIKMELLRIKKERFPNDEFDRQFLAISGLSRANINHVHQNSIPAHAGIKKWAAACGLTVTQFFARVEKSAHHKAAPEHPLILAARVLIERGEPRDVAYLTELMQRLVE